MTVDQATLQAAYQKIVAAAKAQGIPDTDIPTGDVTFSTSDSDTTAVLNNAG